MQNSLFAQYAANDALRISITGKQIKGLKHIALTFSIGSLNHHTWSSLFYKGLIRKTDHKWELTEEGQHLLALAELAGLTKAAPIIGPTEDLLQQSA